MTEFFTKNSVDLPLDRAQVIRYAGCPAGTELPMLDPLFAEAEPVLNLSACFCVSDVKVSADGVAFDFAPNVPSIDLSKNLYGCRRAVIFAATVGVGIDRLIAKYSRVSPSRAVILQAIGAERAERFCDALCDHLRRRADRENAVIHPRFSPGYGDLPLEFQRDIFSLLDCPRRIGLTLNDSLLMSPSKSVTAIVGIEQRGVEQ